MKRSALGCLGLLAIVGLMLAIFLPTHFKRLRRYKTVEATMNLRRLHDASVTYYIADRLRRDELSLPRQFPRTVASTPAKSACDGGSSVRFAPDPRRWRDLTWQSLRFEVKDPSFYQYSYVSAGVGTESTFTARANGDLDCNGQLSTFERTGSIDKDGTVSGGLVIYKVNPIE